MMKIVTLSAIPLPPRSGGEGLGVGGAFFVSRSNAIDTISPHPRPLPATMLRIAGGGEQGAACAVSA